MSLSEMTAESGTLTPKTSNTSAIGVSAGKITGIGQGIEFKASQIDAYIMIGLTASLQQFNSSNSIDFAIYPRPAGKIHVQESRQSRGGKGSYTTSDVLGVRVNSAGKVEYTKNGT